MPTADLAEAKPIRAEHDGVPILLVRSGNRIFALAETCSHFSGPLSEDKLVGDSIVSPWHASRFALEGGRGSMDQLFILSRVSRSAFRMGK